MLDTDVEVDLEQLLNAPHCELTHESLAPQGYPCSHTPVMRVYDCSHNKNGRRCCINAVQYILDAIRERVGCEDCLRPVQDCWILTPL